MQSIHLSSQASTQINLALQVNNSSCVISTDLLPTIYIPREPDTHIREELVDDGEGETVNLHIVVLLQSFNPVQSITLFNHQTHLLHLLDLCRCLWGSCVCVCGRGTSTYCSGGTCNDFAVLWLCTVMKDDIQVHDYER